MPLSLRSPSKSDDLAARLRNEIASGELQPGDRLPSFAEMRARHGAASHTVGRIYRVLEQDGLVRREHGRGVFVADRSTKAKQHVIGIMGFDVKSGQAPYWVHLMEGIQEVAHREETEVTFLHPTSRRGLERIDGVLLHGDEQRDDLPPGMPAVSIMGKNSQVPSVLADDFGGMQAATEHLISLGHRRIACLVFTDAPIIQIRLAGYRAALEAAGIQRQESWVRNIEQIGLTTVRSHAHFNMERWLQSDWHKLGCTALLCQNDQAAIGAMQALHENGLRVPEDVSVVGFDGTEEGEQSTPRLTSVHIPLDEIGMRAAELLFRQIHEERVEAGVLTLPAALDLRASTAPPPQI